MKRTIEFRGKRIDTDEWTVGSLIVTHKGITGITTFTGKFVDGKIRAVIDEVYPETVGQYTGAKDKNGKEIYEGDILNIQFCTETTVPMFVSFVDGGWHIQEDLDYEEYHYLDDYKDDATIIGNIYDNPELLESPFNK